MSLLLQVDRAHYAPGAPYEDSPQSIGHKATISAPHMHATAAESLLPHILPSDKKPAPRVLDIGSGSGYLTHLLAELAGEKGLVVGLEHIQALRDLGEKNMGKSAEGRELLESGRVRFHIGDGRKGWTEPPRGREEAAGTGWDAIHVGAAAVELHQDLVDQLRAPGRWVICFHSIPALNLDADGAVGCSSLSRTTTATASTCGQLTRRRMGLLSRKGCLAFDMCH